MFFSANFSFPCSVLGNAINDGEKIVAFFFKSGVIGTSKLHFDIWGDSVNVASRMYSTAEPNRIQLTEKAKLLLEEEKWGWGSNSRVDEIAGGEGEGRGSCFTYRGKVWVKGKGHMDTYYFKEPK